MKSKEMKIIDFFYSVFPNEQRISQSNLEIEIDQDYIPVEVLYSTWCIYSSVERESIGIYLQNGDRVTMTGGKIDSTSGVMRLFNLKAFQGKLVYSIDFFTSSPINSSYSVMILGMKNS